MKRLLLLLPLVALAACSGKPEATITAPNAPKYNLADQYKQQIVDRAALKKRCEYEFKNAPYEGWKRIVRFSIKNENGRRPIYRIEHNDAGECNFYIGAFFEETYYSFLNCDPINLKISGEKSSHSRWHMECYVAIEGKELVVYEKNINNGIIRKIMGKMILNSTLYPY